jgi:hypothetical protein
MYFFTLLLRLKKKGDIGGYQVFEGVQVFMRNILKPIGYRLFFLLIRQVDAVVWDHLEQHFSILSPWGGE